MTETIDNSVKMDENWTEAEDILADLVSKLVDVAVNSVEEKVVISEEVSIIESSEDKPDIDETRLRRNAEFYAKRLNEVRGWLVECLGEDHVPPAYGLEEDICCGVLLARLANYFAPESVQLDKIFDLNKERLHKQGLQYRHTDNILKWRRACQSVKVMSIILPEPADVYAGRNIKTIFALIELANRLHSLGKAPPLHDHVNFVLTDDDFHVLRDRIAAAPETEGIDWEVIQQDQSKIEPVEEIIEEKVEEVIVGAPPVDSFPALRQLCEAMEVSPSLYDADFLIEDQKKRLNKLLESNEAMKTDLQELEANIGLLVKNFRSIKDQTDKKAETERKKEIEKACQASSPHESSDDGVYNDDETSASSYDGEEPRSLARISRQTVDTQEDRVQPDHLLIAKASVLSLLNAKVCGESVNELASNKTSFDSKTQAKIEEIQSTLQSALRTLIESHQLSDYSDLVALIFWDFRHENEREQVRKERMEYLDKMLENASKNAQQMIFQISAYRTYEEACLKNMTGGVPSINLANELNKKVRKFLNRKQNAVNKSPIKLSAEKMIKKRLLFMDDVTTPKKVSKYSMIITPLEVPGYYKFESLLDGEIKHTQTILFETLLRREALGQFRMPFQDPIVFDCLGLRRYLDRKYHSKNFI